MEACLIIFDIDETLYNNQTGCIPERTLDALDQLKAAGHTLAIATGRAPFELIEVVKSLPFDFFILANGQLVLRNDEVIYENAIDEDVLHDILNETQQSGIHIGFNSATHSSVTGLTPQMRQAFEKYYTTMPEVSTRIDQHEAIYQMWYLSEDITAIRDKFKDKLRFLPWLTGGADVIPVGASKAIGLAKTMEILAHELPKKVIFFGDGINDLELIQMADIGVAMGNAVPSVKAVADFVTKSIDDDGIYYACEQLNLFDLTDEHHSDVDALILKRQAKIENDPDDLENYLQLKTLYATYLKDPKAAVDILEQALQHFSDNILLLLEIAVIYEFELDDFSAAKLYYEKVLALQPTHQLALDALDALNDLDQKTPIH
ncbi:MAG: Cof-type HAD-IIB family hydrolase [Defluviitaleaceae bacterium]|nr:Cof-type HAD-IIB family hydrolase [Defluviitaleaceae bacterium]